MGMEKETQQAIQNLIEAAADLTLQVSVSQIAIQDMLRSLPETSKSEFSNRFRDSVEVLLDAMSDQECGTQAMATMAQTMNLFLAAAKSPPSEIQS